MEQNKKTCKVCGFSDFINMRPGVIIPTFQNKPSIYVCSYCVDSIIEKVHPWMLRAEYLSRANLESLKDTTQMIEEELKKRGEFV